MLVDRLACGCVFDLLSVWNVISIGDSTMTETDLVTVHNKAQFTAIFFEGLATAKQLPASLRPHLSFARSTCKNFLKPHQRLQRIAEQKIPLDKDFDSGKYASELNNLRQILELKNNATLTAAMSQVEESIKASRQPLLRETMEMLEALSKETQLPQAVLKPTLVAMVNAQTFDAAEVDEIAGKITGSSFTVDQVWDTVQVRMEATRDGRVASYRKQGKTAPVQTNATTVGYFQVVDTPKEKQFASMPMTPGLANAMACGPQRVNFTHLDACDHPATRLLLEDLTNILIIGTNVADVDHDKSVAVTLKSIDPNDVVNMSFRTIVEKSMSQPVPSEKSMPKQAAGGVEPKLSAIQGSVPKETTFEQVAEQLKQLGAGVIVPVEMLDAVFTQLLAQTKGSQHELERLRTEIRTKADANGKVSFPVIQEVIISVFGTKLAGTTK